jgi:hypothetical protein
MDVQAELYAGDDKGAARYAMKWDGEWQITIVRRRLSFRRSWPWRRFACPEPISRVCLTRVGEARCLEGSVLPSIRMAMLLT